MSLRVRSLTAIRAVIPLKRTIKHASKTRTANDALLVRCELSDGSIGWGEGLSREYVTGDSPDAAWATLGETLDAGCPVGKLETLYDTAQALEPWHVRGNADDSRRCFGNPARAAVETSILDAAGHATDSVVWSLGTFVDPRRSASRGEVRYGVVGTPGSRRKLAWSGLRARLYGFPDVKFKVGLDGVDDAACLSALRLGLGRSINLRLDANESWPAAEVERHVGRLRRFDISSVEQPCPHAEVHALPAVRRNLGVPVMLDESLCSLEDAQAAVVDGTCDLFNLRVSKCGGIMPTLRVLNFAREYGIGCQLGCMVGETGILSAAGRAVACTNPDLIHLEGSYDRHLVAEPLTREDLTFGRGGRAPALLGPGLGITVDEAAVKRVTKESRTWTW